MFPLLLGSTGAERPFGDLPDVHLDLLTSEVLDDRIVALDYRVR